MKKLSNIKISPLTVKMSSDERMGMMSAQNRFNVMYDKVYAPVALDNIDYPIAYMISEKIES